MTSRTELQDYYSLIISIFSLNVQNQASLEMDIDFEGNNYTLTSSIRKVTKSAEKESDHQKI